MSDFETWWQQEGQEFLYALNTTTDDDIKLVAEIAWKNGAYCAEQAEQEPAPWKHDCAALCMNDVELWIDNCPHCGKPRTAPSEPVKQEPVYAFRRRGLDDFCTCTKERYDELVDKPNLFEVTTFYAEPVGAEHFLKAIAALREGIATCRAEALEEAAKVCEEVAKHYITNHKEQEQVWLLAATSDCAAAIRGLK